MKHENLIKGFNSQILILIIAGILFLSCSRPKDKPLNYIFINIDDMGWTALGCYGSDYHETPNIDRLATEGMRFTNAYAAAAICSPTRASIMTGKYPARIGITNWIAARFQGAVVPENKINPTGYVGTEQGTSNTDQRKMLTPVNPLWMELEELTIAEVLKTAGYTNGHVGKWHLGPDDWYPKNQGFDFNAGGCDYGEPPTFFDPYIRTAEENWISKDSIIGIPTLPPRKKGEYLTDREADEAVRFIRENGNKPFFLNYNPYAVHNPVSAKEELIAKYKARPNGRYHKGPIYAAMIESVDQAVGKILDMLDELKIADRTVVVFTSDNGAVSRSRWDPDMAENNLPLRSQKGNPYEGGIRVPLIVKWPGVVEAGSISHDPVISIDFFPTVCEILNVQPPEDRIVDGISIVPLLTNSGTLKRESIFWHYPHYRGRASPYSVIRQGDWKLIKWYEDERLELYNLSDDLSEETDLAELFPDRVKAMSKTMNSWLTETEAKMPRLNPDFIEPD